MNHNIRKLAGVAMMSGLGLWTATMPAQASAITQFGESVQVTNSPTVAIPGGGNVLESYANVAGNFGSAPGITINSNDSNAVINFSPNPALQFGGLTSGSLSVTSQAGSGDVSGSLATGTTHLESTTSDGSPESDANINIGAMDGLTFHVAGGGSANVTLTYSLDGSLSFEPSVSGSYSQSIEYFIGSADMDWTAAAGNNGSTQVGTGETSGFNSFTYTNNTPSGFQFQGTFTVTDGEALNLFFAQSMQCGGTVTCDFENTGQMGLILPTGTTFTSNSGVFLTQTGSSAPEPGSLLLMGLGMAAIGCFRRRRLAR